MIGRILIYLSIFVASAAVALTLLFTPQEISELIATHLPILATYGFFQTSNTKLPTSAGDQSQSHKPASGSSSKKGEVLLTVDELKDYSGAKGSKGLYLAILGRVYDVKKGNKHYGPGGGYSFFAGKDGTRAFVSGDFTDKGLIPDITGLTHQDMLGIEDWIKLYDKDYKYVGKLIGHYYDANGQPTENFQAAQKALVDAKQWKAQQDDENKMYPPCNSEWSQDKGGRVWCSNKSGGMERSWTGVPRKLFKPGSKDYRCACIRDTGPSSTGEGGNRGDLDMASLQEYDKCQPKSVSCKIS